MKKLTRAITLIVGAIVSSQTVQASITPNDLYMGFQNQAGGGSADYIVNLGSVSSLISSDPSIPVNLSSDFTMSAFTSSGLSGTNAPSTLATIMGGAVGGTSGNPADIYVTQQRLGGAGNGAIPGSSAPTGLTRSQDIEAFNSLSPLNAPAAGNGVLDSSLSWENDVEPNFTAHTFSGITGIDPDSPIVPSGVTYEDLWGSTSSGGVQSFLYEGFFTIDLTGSNPDVTFTAAPEPSSFVLSGAGGILMLLLRNRLSRKNA